MLLFCMLISLLLFLISSRWEVESLPTLDPQLFHSCRQEALVLRSSNPHALSHTFSLTHRAGSLSVLASDL